ncbi:MAG: primosomal protein N' (replication factor Y) [Candidatus Deianiraeaceae bacterium]|jgi:primosomal protein N' (replication factor Y)
MTFIEFLPFLPVEGTFEYKTDLAINKGDILKCRFGGFDCLGIAITINNTQQTQYKLASVGSIVFKELISQQNLEFTKKLSQYYGYNQGLFAKMFFPFSIKNYTFANQTDMVRLRSDAKMDSSRSAKWHTIYNTLQHGNTVEASIFTGLSYFKNKNLLEFFKEEIHFANYQMKKIISATLPDLSGEQSQVLQNINIDGFQTHLIHGKTGSGKTEVYAHLAQKILAEQNTTSPQILIMLPEIGLAKVIAQRLEQRLNCKIPVWHSSTLESLRKQYFQEIQSGACNVIIGTRSSLFLPFPNLQMIIVDEEHDGSYKQEEAPIYNARDSAILYGKILNIPVILGSATPSVESYHNAQINKYQLHELTARFNKIQMPEVKIINEKTNGILCDTVQSQILEHYQNGNQVLVFINRRGYSPINKCKACKGVFKCDSCDAHLIYHKKKSVLSCHKCGWNISTNTNCIMCEEELEIHSTGSGVEAVHEEVTNLITKFHLTQQSSPSTINEIKIFSSDEQNTEKKLSTFIETIQNGQTKIIIGTQIASKGYDFPNLKLVCIVDLLLKNDEIDFKCDEKLMQLLTQVSGRSGRSGTRGTVLIQSKREEALLKRLLDENQPAFYQAEIQSRKDNFLPPFSRFISITFLSKEEKALSIESRKITEIIHKHIKCNIFGPAPAPIAFIKNTYRYKVLLISHKSQLDIPSTLRRILKNAKCKTKIDVDAINFY